MKPGARRPIRPFPGRFAVAGTGSVRERRQMVSGSSTWSQGEAGWGSSCWGRCGASRARRVAGQVVPPAYGAAVGVVQGGER